MKHHDKVPKTKSKKSEELKVLHCLFIMLKRKAGAIYDFLLGYLVS